MKSSLTPLSLRNLSIRKQLPALICILLLSIIILFGSVAYFGIKRTALAVGRERLQGLSTELGSIFQQSTAALTGATQVIGNQPDIISYLSSNKDSAAKALATLNKLRLDSLSLLIELQDTQGRNVLSTGMEIIQQKTDLNAARVIAASKPLRSLVGRIYHVRDSIYFPIMVSVIKDKMTVGYLIRWRLLMATPKAIAQLSELMGTKATIFFGNADGSFWTDMVKPVSLPGLDIKNYNKVMHYNQGGNNPVIASVVPIPGSRWIMLVELSEGTILDPASRFLYWVIGIGAVLLAIGIAVAWMISRNITRPLSQLMRGTAAVASGDFGSPVLIDRQDELGKLAASFNTMAQQIQDAQAELEKKVKERTQELEIANRELEAFSYSVSHDLRAPLRAVSGYTIMLKEDYEGKLDAEGDRIINNVIANVKMMGQLIDDLIEFSRLGKTEISSRLINMNALVESCFAELPAETQKEKFQVNICSLPNARGDERMIRQVWMNLISNAIKYSSKIPEPQLEIGFGNRDHKSFYYIRDNGVGFDMRYAHKLFNVFQRLHSQEEFEGTGVGLALTKRIIQKHHGNIWAESTPGKGASFFFTLPDNNKN